MLPLFYSASSPPCTDATMTLWSSMKCCFTSSRTAWYQPSLPRGCWEVRQGSGRSSKVKASRTPGSMLLGGSIVAQAAAACGLGGASRRAAVHTHLGPSGVRALWLSPAMVEEGGQLQVPSGPSVTPAGSFGLCVGLLGSGQQSQDLSYQVQMTPEPQ